MVSACLLAFIKSPSVSASERAPRGLRSQAEVPSTRRPDLELVLCAVHPEITLQLPTQIREALVSRSDFVDWLFWLRFRGEDCIAVNRRLWLLAEGVRAVVTASQRHYKQDTLVLVTEPATEAPSG